MKVRQFGGPSAVVMAMAGLEESLSAHSRLIQLSLQTLVPRGGGLPDFQNLVLSRPHAPHLLFGNVSGSASLGPSVTRSSQGHDCYRQYLGCVLYQQAGGHGPNPFFI